MFTLTLDREAAGQSAPPRERQVIALDANTRDAAYGWRESDRIWIEVPRVAAFHVTHGDATVTAVPAADVEPRAVLEAYYGTALPFAVQATRGFEVLHGSGVVSSPQGAVASFCGSSRVGKSTVAYGLASRGQRLWADDSVAFVAGPDAPLRTVGLPFAVKLRESSAAHFGVDGARERTLDETFVGAERPLGAVFLLEPVEGDALDKPECERLDPATALRAVLPNAYRFRPASQERQRATMAAYLELVASVPVTRVRYPRDLDRLAELLDMLEARIAGA